MNDIAADAWSESVLGMVGCLVLEGSGAYWGELMATQASLGQPPEPAFSSARQ